MLKLLFKVFIIQLYARNYVFKYIKKKDGQEITIIFRSFGNLKTKCIKDAADIRFIKLCKNENIIPTFAR